MSNNSQGKRSITSGLDSSLPKNRIADCSGQEIIATFWHNCRDKGILNTLAHRRVRDFTELSDLVRKYYAMESTWQAQQMRTESIHAEQPRGAQRKHVPP